MLDIGAHGMVAQIDQHFCFGATFVGKGERHAPVGDIGVIESRLEELVFDQHAATFRQGVVSLFQALFKPALATCDIRLTGVVRAVGKPQTEQFRIGLAHDVDTFVHVIQRLLSHCRIPMPKAAQLVVRSLKYIGIDRPDPNAQIGGLLLECREVVHLVPGNVQRHRRTHPRHFVHLRRILQTLVHVPGSSILLEHAEAGSGIPIAPGRRFDLLGLQLRLDLIDIDPSKFEVCGQRRELSLQSFL